MNYLLTNGVRRHLIRELRAFWGTHPKYRDLVNNIQGKYAFDERPHHSIIIKGTGTSRVDLSADNYKGIVYSYCYLTGVQNHNSTALEWVREDSRAIQANGGLFPSAPGVYYIDISEGPQFTVTPYLDEVRELILFSGTSGMLQHAPIDGTIRLFELPSGFQLAEGVNYTVEKDYQGKPTGEIILTEALKVGVSVQADYRRQGTIVGPKTLTENRADNTAIPGVVLAFGRRVEAGDRMAVVVQDTRRPAALEYGGRTQVGFDIQCTSTDEENASEIAERTYIWMLGVLRSRWSFHGLEIMDVSLGGESEEVRDETGDDYFFMTDLSLQVETEWSLHVPLNIMIRSVAPLTLEQARAIAGMSDDDLTGQLGDIKALEALSLQAVQDPFWSGKPGTFEVIR